MNKWISVMDKLPETPDPVLAVALHPRSVKPRVYAMCYAETRWSDEEDWAGSWNCAQGDGYGIPTQVTHWMPMPMPPPHTP